MASKYLLESVIDGYDASNQSSLINLVDSNVVAVGQSITGNGDSVASASFYLKKAGSPTGNATVKIYAHSGAFGTSSIGTGTALATSDPVNVSTLTTTFATVSFIFSGINQISLSNGVNYVVTVEYTATGDFVNYIIAGTDTVGPVHLGNSSTRNGTGTWTTLSADSIFTLYSTNTTDAYFLDEVTSATYYLDASDASVTDPNAVWTNDANAFDGNTATTAFTTTVGSVSTNYLYGQGTDAPSTGDTIAYVRARMHGQAPDGFSGGSAAIYTDTLGGLLGTLTGLPTASAGYTSFITLSVPTGGWTWAKVAALEAKLYSGSSVNQTAISRVEFEVNTVSTATSYYLLESDIIQIGQPSSYIETGFQAGATETFSHTVPTDGTNTMLVVGVMLWQDVAGTGTMSGITYNGVAMTSGVVLTNGAMRAELWYLPNPATGTNNIAATISGATDDRKFFAATFNGVAQTSPVEDSDTIAGATATASLTSTTTTAEDVIIDLFSHFGTQTMTPNSGQVTIGNDKTGSSGGAMSFRHAPTPGSNATGWTTTGTNDFSYVSMALKPASTSGSILTSTQSSIARIANDKTKTQPAVARIATTPTKTQPAISRISNTRSLTQSAISRLARNVTKTQSATARIVNTGMVKTQGAIARIATNRALTQPSIARIANTKTLTQPTIARISNTITKTQPAIARLEKTVTKTQPAIARIQQGGTKTQPAISRISNTFTKTQPSVARVATNRTLTQGATAKIVTNTTVAKTQNAIARIATNRSNTQAAISRIANTLTKTQPSIARIANNRTLTQPSIARIARNVTKTQPASARIQTTSSKTQPAVARIAQAGTKTQTATSRISQTYTKTQPSIARVATNLTKTQTATASITINGVNTRTQGAVARIATNRSNTQTSTARLSQNYTKTQPAVSRIAKNLTKTQPSTARIATTNTKTQPVISRIATNRNLTNTAISRISSTFTKTQPTIARVATNRTLTQSATAKISTNGLQLTKTQPATGRIAVTRSNTQTATGRIAKRLTLTQGATSRISSSYTKTQGAISRISNNRTKTQTATARITAILTRVATQTATGRIATSRSLTQTSTARILVYDATYMADGIDSTATTWTVDTDTEGTTSITADGQNSTAITFNSRNETAATWSPDTDIT
jgi:hypothetical protein